MAESDILNPLDWPAAGLTWNPNPSYATSRKASPNRQIQRPRMGPWNTRDILNGGHVFSMSWIGTDLTTKQRIDQFYHSFKGGYFTYIDVDSGGRHFVGRFTSEPEAAETANGKWNIQGVTFEEGADRAHAALSQAIGSMMGIRSPWSTTTSTRSPLTWWATGARESRRGLQMRTQG